MEDYKVEIRFPREGAADPNLITVAGHNNDDVYDCIDVLRDEEEKWLEDNADRVCFHSLLIFSSIRMLSNVMFDDDHACSRGLKLVTFIRNNDSRIVNVRFPVQISMFNCSFTR